MELAIIITVGVVFVLLGLVCIATIIVGLPGAWIMLGLAVAIELIDPVYMAGPETVTFGWWLIGAGAVLALIGEGFELLAGALGAKRAGSSRRGMYGALIGGVAGAILFMPVPVPLIAPLVGAIVGTFVGAVAGELSSGTDTKVRDTLRPAAGATIGRILGTLSKLPIAVAIWAGLSIAAFWP